MAHDRKTKIFLASRWNSIEPTLETLEKGCVDLYLKKNEYRSAMIKLDETKRQDLYDYVFGKTDVNPFEDIDKIFSNEIDRIKKAKSRMYKKLKLKNPDEDD